MAEVEGVFWDPKLYGEKVVKKVLTALVLGVRGVPVGRGVSDPKTIWGKSYEKSSHGFSAWCPGCPS